MVRSYADPSCKDSGGHLGKFKSSRSEGSVDEIFFARICGNVHRRDWEASTTAVVLLSMAPWTVSRKISLFGNLYRIVVVPLSKPEIYNHFTCI